MLTAVLALLTPPTLAAAPPPIVRGERTDDYPEVVLLRHTTADGNVAFICTGTLITPSVVLTAAHCLSDVSGYNLTDIRVSSGSVWTKDVPERLASDWKMHPDYSVSSDGMEIVADLGLVYLDEPYAIAPHALSATAPTDADIGTNFRYVGWGASSDTAGDQGYYKRVADIPLDGFETEFLLGYDGENGSATCGGDSGAPVFALNAGVVGAEVAVHSFGRDDDGTICAGSISGDTRVDLYLDWLLAEVPDVTVDEGGGDTGTIDTGGQDTGGGEDTGRGADEDTGKPGGGGQTEEPAGLCATVDAAAGAWVVLAVGLVSVTRRRTTGRDRSS